MDENQKDQKLMRNEPRNKGEEVSENYDAKKHRMQLNATVKNPRIKLQQEGNSSRSGCLFSLSDGPRLGTQQSQR